MNVELNEKLQFEIVHNGTFEMTPDTGVTENRPTCSILKLAHWTIMIDIDHPAKDSADIVNSLASLGISPRQINVIIFTHLHPDHMGHKDIFPNALFIFHKDEKFSFYFKNNRAFELEGGVIWEASNNSMPKYINYTPDLKNLNESIYIRHCPGHTKGSLAIFVCINGLVHVFAGDTFLSRDYYDKWLPPGMSWNPELIYDHMSFIKDNADVIIPGHDAPFRV